MADGPNISQHLRQIRFRYRVQAFLIVGHHFFIQSPLFLDVFVILFILVSNFMNRRNSVPSQLYVGGIRSLTAQRGELLC